MFIIWKDIIKYSINQEEIDFNKQDSYIKNLFKDFYLKNLCNK